jgi:hypothetical protein
MRIVFLALLLATVLPMTSCGGNLKVDPDAGTGAAGRGATTGATTTASSASSSTGQGAGGSSSSGVGGAGGTGGPVDCIQKDCEGLGAEADAKLCPDGTALGRTVCRRVGERCGWDFPDCPAAPQPMDASAVPGRRPITECPLVPPHDPGMLSGGCALLGRWSLNSSHGIVQSMGVIEFGSDGAYYGGPLGIDLSQTYAYDGAYLVDMSSGGATFHLLYSCGDGCNGSGEFKLEFQSGCAVAILQETITECTGNRKVMAGKVVLTRL